MIEPHPDVLKRVDAFPEKWAGVTFRRETWQESLRDEAFGPFDAVRAQRPVTSPSLRRRGGESAHAIDATLTTQIFFDTYAERYEDMRQFFRALPRILAKGGVFSFFNGLAPFNPFFHGVACEFVKCELDSIGLDCDFVPLQVDQSAHDDKTWDGVRRRYWRFDAYHLPLASHKTT